MIHTEGLLLAHTSLSDDRGQQMSNIRDILKSVYGVIQVWSVFV